jgi:peptidyl-prolyl cis-trans isomerase C
MLNKLLHEPLAHFLVLGALMFLVYALVADDSTGDGTNRIEVDTGTIQRLEDSWARQWQRQPTAQELTGLIENYIREEVLYREAIAMGLDQDDTIIRRRLAQKMEFLSADLAMQVEPTDGQLRTFLAENRERFLEPARISFRHVYFSLDKRGQSAKSDAEALRATLEASDIGDDTVYGDRFMLDSEFAMASEREIAGLFGQQFAADIFVLDTGAWTGPVASGLGLHLVYISERLSARLPEFDNIRDRVRNEYMTNQRAAVDQAVYQSLKARYEIIIDLPEVAAEAS